MKIFLDTANLKEIREGAAWAWWTASPPTPACWPRSSGDPEEILLEICKTVDGPISAEVVATDLDGMVREGRALGRRAQEHRREGARARSTA